MAVTDALRSLISTSRCLTEVATPCEDSKQYPHVRGDR